MLDFRVEGLGFDAWPGRGDCTFEQGNLHTCPFTQEYKWVPTVVGEVHLRQTGILCRGVVIESLHVKETRKQWPYGSLVISWFNLMPGLVLLENN